MGVDPTFLYKLPRKKIVKIMEKIYKFEKQFKFIASKMADRYILLQDGTLEAGEDVSDIQRKLSQVETVSNHFKKFERRIPKKE